MYSSMETVSFPRNMSCVRTQSMWAPAVFQLLTRNQSQIKSSAKTNKPSYCHNDRHCTVKKTNYKLTTNMSGKTNNTKHTYFRLARLDKIWPQVIFNSSRTCRSCKQTNIKKYIVIIARRTEIYYKKLEIWGCIYLYMYVHEHRVNLCKEYMSTHISTSEKWLMHIARRQKLLLLSVSIIPLNLNYNICNI